MFKRRWLKVGTTPLGFPLECVPATSLYNTAGASTYVLTHIAPILGDFSPAALATNQDPRDMRDNMRVTALKGYIHAQCPRMADPDTVQGTIVRATEGIIALKWDSASGLPITAGSAPLTPLDTRFHDSRWLWRRELMATVSDDVSDSAPTGNGRLTQAIHPVSRELIHIEPKILLEQDETLYYMVTTEGVDAQALTQRINSQVSYFWRFWVDLRVLSWARA